ncbi:Ankyrin-2 [Phytophthora citrophthora]|uniref:Ankyrin-2 n=1 Tax=Phytophthora citrophthora TaxID=4793 RepID=A0AAD9LPN5_9STRA|nr:Ankyrin-2 [Phytophthora citrophthora]
MLNFIIATFATRCNANAAGRSGSVERGAALWSARGWISTRYSSYACSLGSTELVSEIIAADPNAVNNLGNTKFTYSPLHIAVRFEHESIVKLLLAASPSAKVNAVDSQAGFTPLHLAIIHGNRTIVKLLLDDNSIQQLQTKVNGTTPVELAEELKLLDIQALLVNHATRASGRAQIASWLASIGLVEYASSFFDEGFEDANFLLGTGGLDGKTLDVMNILKAGHRAKLASLYQLKEFLQVESQEESEDEPEEDDSEEEESDDDESGSDEDSS